MAGDQLRCRPPILYYGSTMSISIEAIYEAGVLKPLSPLPDLKEHEKVRLTLETVSRIAEQRNNRLHVDPKIAREIGDSHEYDSLES